MRFGSSPLLIMFTPGMLVLIDGNVACKKDAPLNYRVCPRGVWNDHILVETASSYRYYLFTPSYAIHTERVVMSRLDYLLCSIALSLALALIILSWPSERVNAVADVLEGLHQHPHAWLNRTILI